MISKRSLFSAILAALALWAPPAGAQTPDATPVKPSLMVVLIYDQSCITSCTVVKPIVRELATEKSVQYEELNTSPDHLKETMARAKQLHIGVFVSDRTEEVPVVGLFTMNGKRLAELVGKKSKEVYKEAIEKALRKAQS